MLYTVKSLPSIALLISNFLTVPGKHHPPVLLCYAMLACLNPIQSSLAAQSLSTCAWNFLTSFFRPRNDCTPNFAQNAHVVFQDPVSNNMAFKICLSRWYLWWCSLRVLPPRSVFVVYSCSIYSSSEFFLCHAFHAVVALLLCCFCLRAVVVMCRVTNKSEKIVEEVYMHFSGERCCCHLEFRCRSRSTPSTLLVISACWGGGALAQDLMVQWSDAVMFLRA